MTIALGTPFRAVAIATLLVVGVAATAFGLGQQNWPEVLPGGGYGYLIFIGGLALILWLGTRMLRLGYAAATTLLGVAIVVLAGGVWPALVVAIYLGASLCLGTLVLDRLCGQRTAVGDPYRILVGACLYATAAGFAVHFPINHSWVYLVALVAPMVVTRGYLAATVATLFQRLGERGDHRGGLERPLLGALVLLYLAMAFLPELSHDPLLMHLFVPAYVAANKSWGFDPELYWWTFMPMLADWGYTIAHVLAGEAAARLANLGFLLLAACFVRECVLMLGGNRRGADWAALLLLSTPLTLLVGASAYVEPLWSACVAVGTVWVFRAVCDTKAHPEGMLHAGVALGFAVATKAVALVYLPLLALPVLCCLRVLRSKAFLVASLKGAAAFLILGAWPYALAYVETGNPVFPFFNSLFKSPFYPLEDFNNILFDVELTWKLPYQLVFASEQFIEGSFGSAGLQWLALGVPAFAALLALRVKRAGLLLALALLSLLLVFQFQAYLRYVFPVLLLLCALVGAGMSHCKARYPGVGVALAGVAGLAVLINLLFLGAATPLYRDVPVLDVFSPERLEKIGWRRRTERKAVVLVNAVNEQRVPVAFLAQEALAGLVSPALYGRDFRRELRAAETPASFANVLSRHRGRYLIFDPRHKANPAEFGEFVAETGDLLGQFGQVMVYRLKDELFFAKELVEGPSRFGTPPWILSDGVELLVSGAMAVTVGEFAVQDVAVREGDLYWQRVTARCHGEPGLGRVQVNWRDRHWNFLKTDIRVFECSRDWRVVGHEVAAPAGATTARIYANAHGNVPVEIAEVSFREALGHPKEIQ